MGFLKSTLSRTFSVCSGQVRGCGKLSTWAVFTLSIESVYCHSSLTFFGPHHGGQSHPRRPLPTWACVPMPAGGINTSARAVPAFSLTSLQTRGGTLA